MSTLDEMVIRHLQEMKDRIPNDQMFGEKVRSFLELIYSLDGERGSEIKQESKL